MTEPFKFDEGTVREGGGLHDLSWYLDWKPYSEDATLDGEFSAVELRAIADHMDANRRMK